MKVTLVQFADAYLAAAKTALENAGLGTGTAMRVEWPNTPFDPSSVAQGQVWARVGILHGQSQGLTIDPLEARRTGNVFFQLFVEEDTGTDAIYTVAQACADFLELANAQMSILNARFHDVAIVEVGNEPLPETTIGRERKWFQLNVTATFQYDTSLAA